MSDANLVEKVEAALRKCAIDNADYDALARAAIAVAVEEAKRVLMEDCHDDMTRDEEAEAIRKAFFGDAK